MVGYDDFLRLCGIDGYDWAGVRQRVVEPAVADLDAAGAMRVRCIPAPAPGGKAIERLEFLFAASGDGGR